MEHVTENIDALNLSIHQQLRRLDHLKKQQRHIRFMQIEYRRYVELVTKKYVVLLENALTDRQTMTKETYTATIQRIKERYTQEIVSIALALDTSDTT